MITFTDGDMFTVPADIRVNSVNCVGVMGAGVALVFKNNYPAMYKQYVKDCREGKVKPGMLNIWKNPPQEWIINFPTKRHWREPSQYEFIEAGLVALHHYLKDLGKIKIAIPALGSGHGGLDWNYVSEMICSHLSDLESDIIVFNPASTMTLEKRIKTGLDEKSMGQLRNMGVIIAEPISKEFPVKLRGTSAATFYIKGDASRLNRALLTIFTSAKPSEREKTAVMACMEAVSKPGVIFLLGYGTEERVLAHIALQRGAEVVLFLIDGILRFHIRKDLQNVWDENRITVFSVTAPNERWSHSAALRSKNIALNLAKVVLMADPDPRWTYRFLKECRSDFTAKIFYISYNCNENPFKNTAGRLPAIPIGKDKLTGKPNVTPINRALGTDDDTVNYTMHNMTTPRVFTDKTSVNVNTNITEVTLEINEPILQTIERKSSTYPKRLIEVDLPIKKVSEHARREKSIRHGHISTLHIWWARRPLAACRAVICAALWPDPGDPNCPAIFKTEAARLMKAFRDLRGGKPYDWNDGIELRKALLDFIADFSNWDNSNNRVFLETSRKLTKIAHESLGGDPGTRPLVVDPFAGGGSIPLESLRVGADAFASDLNPVAVLLNKVVLEYIPKYGQRLADEVRKWGNWIKEKAENDLMTFFPCQDRQSPPVAYLWARTIQCEGPGCGVQVPLIRSLCLAKRGRTSVALRMLPDKSNKCINFEIATNVTTVSDGTVKRGSVTCLFCGYTTSVTRVRKQLKESLGGADSSRLLTVVHRSNNEKSYRIPSAEDLRAIEDAIKTVRREEVIPLTELPLMSGVFNVPLYGITRWDLLFSSRQLVVAKRISDMINIAVDEMMATFHDPELISAVKVLLCLARDKYLDFRSTLCAWINVGEKIGHTFGRQALGMIFDWAEGVPFGDISGSWERSIDYMVEFLEMEAKSACKTGTADQADAQNHPLPDDSVEAFITDPPYYNAVPYSDLSDFFYIWLRKDLSKTFPSFFTESVAPKSNELCEMHGWDPIRYPQKDAFFYEEGMKKAFIEGRRMCIPSGIGVVVFAHKTTAGWESLLSALINSGWIVTGSWPIDTERGGRLRAMNSAALASSVHLVCRPRENPSSSLRTGEIGDWRDVLAELPNRIHEWMPRLAEEGVVGADAIFACLGPALEIYSRYSRVEKASGEVVPLKEYLEHVWAVVAKEALNMIFEGADTTGFEEDARLTAMWLWTLSTGTVNGNDDSPEKDDAEDEEEDEEKPSSKTKLSGYTLEYDAARKIAQGLGAHLEKLHSLVEVKGDKARLLPVAERTRALFGKDEAQAPKAKKKKPQQLSLFEEIEKVDESGAWGEKNVPPLGHTTLDRLHQGMILFAAGRGEALKRFLVEEGTGKDERFWRLAQAFSALYPKNADEKRWVDGVLARKKGLGL